MRRDVEIMSYLYIKQKVFSLGGKFTVKDERQNDKYFVEGSVFSIKKSFVIRDTQDNEIATITKKMFSLHPTFYVAVEGEKEIIIKKALTLFKTRYHIEAEGLEINGDWWERNFDVLRDGQRVASVRKKLLSWGDTFEVEIKDERLEHTIIALVIAIDYVEDSESHSHNGSNN